jgi:ubiquinone/menaquinone biosynthesis C-methylase UbiE
MRVSALEGHRLWAPVYDSTPNPIAALDTRIMRDAIKSIPATRVVDLACGTGRTLRHLCQKFPNVLGIDYCDAMLRQAAQHAPLRHRLALADIAHLPIRDGTADLVVCSLALGYLPDLWAAFHEMSRILAKGGQILISDLHPEATANGWTRSFYAGGIRYDINHHSHLFDDITEVATARGLRLTHRRDAYVGLPELPLFVTGAKEELFSKIIQIPALLIHIWEKPC